VRNAALGREVNYKSFFKAVLGEIERTHNSLCRKIVLFMAETTTAT
jgi:hypothetical protein